MTKSESSRRGDFFAAALVAFSSSRISALDVFGAGRGWASKEAICKYDPSSEKLHFMKTCRAIGGFF